MKLKKVNLELRDIVEINTAVKNGAKQLKLNKEIYDFFVKKYKDFNGKTKLEAAISKNLLDMSFKGYDLTITPMGYKHIKIKKSYNTSNKNDIEYYEVENLNETEITNVNSNTFREIFLNEGFKTN